MGLLCRLLQLGWQRTARRQSGNAALDGQKLRQSRGGGTQTVRKLPGGGTQTARQRCRGGQTAHQLPGAGAQTVPQLPGGGTQGDIAAAAGGAKGYPCTQSPKAFGLAMHGARDAADEGGGNRVFETRVCFLVGSC